MGDVYEEVDGILTKQRVSMHKIKPCKRRYAFEKTEIPKEAEYLKLLYPYDSAYDFHCSVVQLTECRNFFAHGSLRGDLLHCVRY